jgi:hypothetical protein
VLALVNCQPSTYRSRKEQRDLPPPSLTFKIFEDKVVSKTAFKSAMQQGEDAITLLTEDHKKEEEEKMFGSI